MNRSILLQYSFSHNMLNMCLVLQLTDFAGAEKERLEEKQRASRKDRAKNEEEWRTRLVVQISRSNVELKPKT